MFLGIELNKDAVRDARMNAKENQMNNIEFPTGRRRKVHGRYGKKSTRRWMLYS